MARSLVVLCIAAIAFGTNATVAVAGQTHRSTVSLRLTADLIANGVVRSDAHGCE